MSQPTTDAARAYTRAGLFVVPIPHRAKRPTLDDWQHLRIAESDVDRYFNGHPQNVGVLLGASGLVDADLDTPEAAALASVLLPTTRTFGRPGNPSSHGVYRVADRRQTKRYQVTLDGKRQTVAEYRDLTRDGTPVQTVFPPSTHETGEAITWDGEPGEPFAEIEADDLARRVRHLAGAAVLLRYYPRGAGGRHDAAGAVASVFARSGVAEHAAELVRAFAAFTGDDEIGDRVQFAEDTVEAVRQGRVTTGAPTLIEMLATTEEAGKNVRKALAWLDFDGRTAGKETSPPSASPTAEPAQPTPPFVPFPVDALPPVVAKYAAAEAEALNVDVAAVAVPMLPALAGAVGNSFEASPKPGWNERSALWAVLVQPSGTLKSQAVYVAVAPVLDMERDAHTRFKTEAEEYGASLAQWNELSKALKGSTPKPAKPERERYRVGDTTVESVGAVHSERPRGLLGYRDELSGWLGSFNQYNKGDSDLANWMELCGGRPVAIDRKSDDRGVLYIEKPNVSMVGTIQPSTLASKLGSAHFASGFAARLLLTEPPTRPRRWTEASASPESRAAYHALIRALYRAPADSGVLAFTPAGVGVFRAFYDENGAVLDGLRDGPLRASVSKIEGYAVRLALVFHLCAAASRGQDNPAPISADAVERAVVVARWLRYEQARVYRIHAFDRLALDADARKALALPPEFTWQDVADAWSVGKSGAYVVIGRLVEKSIAEAVTHGKYRRVDSGPLDFVDYGTEEAPLVHKVHQSTVHFSGAGLATEPPTLAEPWDDEDPLYS